MYKTGTEKESFEQKYIFLRNKKKNGFNYIYMTFRRILLILVYDSIFMRKLTIKPNIIRENRS